MKSEVKNAFPLCDLPIGKKCRVIRLEAAGNIRRRLLDLGMISGTEITSLEISPSGDPIAYLIRGAVIALRSEDAENILVEII